MESPLAAPVTKLRNIGPRCAEWLAEIGVHTAEELKRIGAPGAYRELVARGIVQPHRMLLYALGGAVSEQDCLKLSRGYKRELEEDADVEHRRR